MRIISLLIVPVMLLLAGCPADKTSPTKSADSASSDAAEPGLRLKRPRTKVKPAEKPKTRPQTEPSFEIPFRLVELNLEPSKRRYQMRELLNIKNSGTVPLKRIRLYFNHMTATFLSFDAVRSVQKVKHVFKTDWIGLIPQKRMLISFDPPIQPGKIERFQIRVEIASRAPFDYVGPRHTTILHSSPLVSRYPLWTKERRLQYSKARFTLIVFTPENTTVIAPLKFMRKYKKIDRWRHMFKPSKTASFLAVVAGDYKKEIHYSGRGAIELWTRRSTALHKSYVKQVLPLLGKTFDYYQQQFGPLPLKTVRVIEYENRHGGKELAGARGLFGGVLLPTTWLTKPFSEPWRYKSVVLDKRRALLHELAHSWWIGAVTPRGPGWWWITEGFSNFLAGRAAVKLVSPAAGQKIFQGYRRRWLKKAGDREPALTRISYLANRKYMSLHYDRGSMVLLALLDLLGPEKLSVGLKAFVKATYNRYTTIAEFERIVSKAVGRDIRPLIGTLVRKPGISRYRIISRKRVGNTLVVVLKNEGTAAVPVPLEAITSVKFHTRIVTVKPGRAATFSIPLAADERVKSVTVDAHLMRLNMPPLKSDKK